MSASIKLKVSRDLRGKGYTQRSNRAMLAFVLVYDTAIARHELPHRRAGRQARKGRSALMSSMMKADAFNSSSTH